MSQNLEYKIHKANENRLTSTIQYGFIPKSMNYEFIIPIVVSYSLKFQAVQFFMDQTLDIALEFILKVPFVRHLEPGKSL